MAKGDGAAMGIDPRVLVVQAEQLQAGQDLRREGFVDLDQADLVQVDAGALQRAEDRLLRADAHQPGLHADAGASEDPRQRPDALALADRAIAQQHYRRPVVDPRGIAGGHYPAGEQRRQARQGRQVGLRPRMLVALHQPRLALASGTHLHRKDLAEEKPSSSAAW